MNYKSMTDMELIHYLDLYATDPLVRRLANMLHNTRGGLISDLEAAGMDPDTWQFETDWQSMYPGDYIQQLRRDIDELESDLDCAKRDLEDAQEERDRLKNRSIGDFLKEVEQERINNRDEVYRVRKEAQAIAEQNVKLKDQIDMWARMNQPERKLS